VRALFATAAQAVGGISHNDDRTPSVREIEDSEEDSVDSPVLVSV
jgi:hypothetical protein